MFHLKEKSGWSVEMIENRVCLIGVDNRFQNSNNGVTRKSTKNDIVYWGMKFYKLDNDKTKLVCINEDSNRYF